MHQEFFTTDATMPIVNITWHIIILGSIMLFTGFLGGVVKFLNDNINPLLDYLEEDTKKNIPEARIRKNKIITDVVSAIGATFVVPLFLSTISSTLLEDSRENPLKYFVYAGFCLLAALFYDKFLPSMGKELISKINEHIKKGTEKAVQKVADVAENAQNTVAQNVEKKVIQKVEDIQSEKFSEQSEKLIQTQNKIADTKKVIAFRDKLKELTTDYSAGKISPDRIDFQDMGVQMKEALELEQNDREDTAIFGEWITFLYLMGKDHMINDAIERYKPEIKISGTTWTDTALANLNMYNYNQKAEYKKNCVNACNAALIEIAEYGVAYLIKAFISLIEYDKTPKDDENKRNVLLDEVKSQLQPIINSPNQYTCKEAYNYSAKNKEQKSYLTDYIEMMEKEFPVEMEQIKQKAGEGLKK